MSYDLVDFAALHTLSTTLISKDVQCAGTAEDGNESGAVAACTRLGVAAGGGCLWGGIA